ncbi:glycosyltransferase family 4 protein [Thermocatellispora tengchongensis]
MPGDVDDPGVPSGGNVYDRRVCRGLAALGRPVAESAIPGAWPRPGADARAELARTLAALPDGAVVLLDGLVACGVPEIVAPEARRLRTAVLVHLPLAAETGLPPGIAASLDAAERATLRAAAAVLVTSPWAARAVAGRHGLDPAVVHVVPPGADPAPLAPGTDGASSLLCVAAVTPRKGHDLLVRALAPLAGLPWACVCAGPLRDPAHAGRVRRLIGDLGLRGRVRLAGPRTGEALEKCYAAADLVVLASRGETYGMVVTEALARGIPVLATAVDALPETLGRAPDGGVPGGGVPARDVPARDVPGGGVPGGGVPGGGVPGMLVPPDDPAALTGALRRWLTEPELRRSLRAAARARRKILPGWEATARRMGGVLERMRWQPLRTT